ncbi:MAG: hypothetical protein WBD07_10350 [Vicinamibacterales bacterium]
MTPRLPRRMAWVGIGMACFVLAASPSFGQAAPRPVEIPPGTTTLEGIPSVRVDSSEGRTTRQVLSSDIAKKNRLLINVVDGKFFWTSRDNRPLQFTSSGDFSYFASEAGSYIRITRINDKISYVEHLDTALMSPAQRPSVLPFGTVTWWGELKIVVGK